MVEEAKEENKCQKLVIKYLHLKESPVTINLINGSTGYWLPSHFSFSVQNEHRKLCAHFFYVLSFLLPLLLVLPENFSNLDAFSLNGAAAAVSPP